MTIFGRRSIGTLAVTTAVVAGSLTPAAAADPPQFRVRAGSAPAGTTVKFTMTSRNDLKFRDVASGFRFTCTGVQIHGTTVAGKQAGKAIARLRARTATATSCDAPVRIEVQTLRTWALDVTKVAHGTAGGQLRGVRLLVTLPGHDCRFGVKGRVPAAYLNKTHRLKLYGGTKPLLVVHNVSGCAGIVATGDKAQLGVSFAVRADRAAYRPIKIKSA